MNKIWPRPRLNPLPDQVAGVENPRISLNGDDWKLALTLTESFYDTAEDLSGWQDIAVPLQVDAGENEYAYARVLDIPASWNKNKIFLRFDGANCLARVYVDGQFVKSHYGGFVSWDCDITEFVTAGGSHRLVIGITDKPNEVNPFHRGGLIRDVTMYVTPSVYLGRLHVETKFDGNYENAILSVSGMIEGGTGSIELKLTSPSGVESNLDRLSGGLAQDLTANYNIMSPLKWDSEHPNLYTLTATVVVDGINLEQASLRFGFRQVERRGSEVFVNGQLLKLRGINRHDIHPVSGRSLSYEQLEADVRLFKNANINFIRTSHYPPSPVFLDLCDRYGMYVEDEIAVSFLGYGTWHTESDPGFTSCFMDQFAELIERDRSHPSVIIWSLANESYWGNNLALMNAYAKEEDPSRLTIFSYPLTQYEDDMPTDIWSNHYDRWDRNLSELTDCFRRSHHDPDARPVLHDESTHIPCYNREEQQRDSGVRDFWGETIHRFWDRLWSTDGALGCAIWAGIDDIRLKDDRSYNYPWGIIDGWRRLKPEYWHTRKGFSPIRVLEEPKAEDECTILTITNRFNHTNLNEVLIKWRLGHLAGSLTGPDVLPRCNGVLVIPAPYISGEELELHFIDPYGNCVDEYVEKLDVPVQHLPMLSGIAPKIIQEVESIVISGQSFSIRFSTHTGLITEGYYEESLVLTGGPTLQLTGLALGPWKLESFEAREDNGAAKVILKGRYDKVVVQFLISIDAEGLMETIYTIIDMPYPSPREIAISGGITSHSGGYDEVGVAYIVHGALQTLSWNRIGLWNYYPEWHISRLNGKASKLNPDGVNDFQSSPDWEWKMDEKDRSNFGKYDIGRRGTRDFTSMKTSILQASLEKDRSAFQVISNGSISVRMEVQIKASHLIMDSDSEILYSGLWSKQDTRFRSMGSSETWSNSAGDYCEYSFKGTGIAWISSLDHICGIANVYIDGELQEEALDLGLSRAGKTARGYKKLYRQNVFSIEGLPFGDHTIKIEVVGKNATGSNNCYVNIDHFIVLDGDEIGDTRFIVNNEFNYPELSWGNYTKPPIKVSSGYSARVLTKLGQ